MNNLSNEALLKRSNHARRNLSVLALLVSAVSLLLIVLCFTAKGAAVIAPLAIGLSLLTAGYWVLAVAAGRGNPTSVGIVIVMAAANIAISLVASGVLAAKAGGTFKPNVGGFIIPILVILALNSSRKVLLELKRRDLWNQVFGAAKPSQRLCIIGGALTIAGMLAFNGTSFYFANKGTQWQRTEMDSANRFVAIVQTQEKEFMSALKAYSDRPGEAEADLALKKVAALTAEVNALQKQAATNSPLQTMLSTYGRGVDQWTEALNLLTASNPDPAEAQKRFDLGDKLREEATLAFDRKYTK